MIVKDKQDDGRRDAGKNLQKRFIQVGLQIVLYALLLFVSAGSLLWYWAWAYIGAYVGVIAVNAFVLPHDLIEERGRLNKNVKSWDKVIMTLSIFPTLGMLVVAGLDWRLGWSPRLYGWIQAGALVLMALGNALFTWSMVSNHFFSTSVRIQSDRGHQVATAGPYKYVRHPGYVGFIATYLATPLILGSLWALIPAGITGVLFIIRTALEDNTLQRELEGYKEYAKKVKYRLLPGIW